MSVARRTIPQIRVAMGEVVMTLRREFGEHSAFDDIDSLMEETKRRSPVRGVARKRDPDPGPEMIRRIRALRPDSNNPRSYKDIARICDTSVRCVSLAFAGHRDGRPVWTPDGERIKYARASRKREKARAQSGFAAEPWE